jgi:hypothetical protein
MPIRYNTALTVERAREALAYDSEIGSMTWRIKPNGRVHAGAAVGHIAGGGYLQLVR